MPNIEINQLLGLLDRAYNRASWHGTNLRGSIRGVSPAVASARPARGRHNIWEIVVHCAYWKYAVRRRLTGEPRGAFPVEGSNWFVRTAGRASQTAWNADIRLLDDMHRRLRAAVAAATPRVLHRRSGGLKTTPFDLIAGVAAHDLYHAGQIQLIKRLRG